MSELEQIVSKVKPNGTHINTANYWAPLADEDNDNMCDEAVPAQQATINNISDAEGKTSIMVVDLGATSSFVQPEENLPFTGLSSKVVNLPNGSTIQATHTTTLSFKALSTEVRKADVLPGLQPNSLVSVGKFANADYTTIFHPHGEGVTVHKKNTLDCNCCVSRSSKGGGMRMVCGNCHV
jgi:hypothetical protein